MAAYLNILLHTDTNMGVTICSYIKLEAWKHQPFCADADSVLTPLPHDKNISPYHPALSHENCTNQYLWPSGNVARVSRLLGMLFKGEYPRAKYPQVSCKPLIRLFELFLYLPRCIIYFQF